MFFKKYRENKDKKIKSKSKRIIKPLRSEEYKKRYNTYPVKTSKLEVKFEQIILLPLGVEYERQKRVSSKFFDFYIPTCDLLIEVDGDYYHAKDRTKALNQMQIKNVMNDHKKTYVASNNGFELIRFWEIDINDTPNKVKIKLATKIQQLLN